MEGFPSHEEYSEAVRRIDQVLSGHVQGVAPDEVNRLMNRVLAYEESHPEDDLTLGGLDEDRPLDNEDEDDE